MNCLMICRPTSSRNVLKMDAGMMPLLNAPDAKACIVRTITGTTRVVLIGSPNLNSDERSDKPTW